MDRPEEAGAGTSRGEWRRVLGVPTGIFHPGPVGCRAMFELSDIETRVLGSLIEKSMATPEYYPMTVKALVAACNQKSNRDPVMNLGEADVMSALDTLRYRHKVVCQVSEAGSRVPKFRHDVAEFIPHAEEDLAILCALMLRGPQTAGELKAHTQRLHPFPDPGAVHRTLDALRRNEPEPLVQQIAPGPGRRESRFVHLLSGPVDELPPSPPPPPPEPDAAPSPAAVEPDRLDRLEAAVGRLREELDRLRHDFDTFKEQF